MNKEQLIAYGRGVLWWLKDNPEYATITRLNALPNRTVHEGYDVDVIWTAEGWKKLQYYKEFMEIIGVPTEVIKEYTEQIRIAVVMLIESQITNMMGRKKEK